MIYPNLSEEKKLWKKGYKYVACADEAGRGPLAGPVVAAAVMINPKHEARNSKQYLNSKSKCSKREFRNFNFGHLNLFRISDLGFGISKLRDSKKLSAKQREYFYEILTKHKKVRWGIGVVSEKVIDRINIFQATKLAMKKATLQLEKKLQHIQLHNSCGRKKHVMVDFLILDGKMTLDIPIPQKSIVRADEKVFSCALASIIAKVTRDRIMVRYHKKYPQYGFNRHKGYGTKFHFKMLKRFGPCPIHRRSFAPVATMLKSQIRNPKFETNSKSKILNSKTFRI